MTALASILPPNSTALEKALDTAVATRVAAMPNPVRSTWSPANIAENLLPWMAYGLGVESWDATMPLTLRRARVAQAIPIHKRKGTVQSIRDVIASYGGTVVLTEWWQQQPQGVPHSFTLQITLGGQVAAPTTDFINGVIADVTRNKPLRSFFTFTVALNAIGSIPLPGAARAAAFARLTCHEA